MNKNLESLISAYKNLGVEYNFYHNTNNLVAVRFKKREFLFINWATPLNPQSIMQLCRDKDYFYNYYKEVLRMPKTIAFLNPYSDPKYEKYLKQQSIFEIIQKVEENLQYPLIVKKNRGSWGINVFSLIIREN